MGMVLTVFTRCVTWTWHWLFQAFSGDMLLVMPAVPYKHYIDCTRLCNMAMAQVLPAVYHRHCNGLYHDQLCGMVCGLCTMAI